MKLKYQGNNDHCVIPFKNSYLAVDKGETIEIDDGEGYAVLSKHLGFVEIKPAQKSEEIKPAQKSEEIKPAGTLPVKENDNRMIKGGEAK